MDEEQKNYKRKHKVRRLEEFGLTEDAIKNELDEVCQHYGFVPEADPQSPKNCPIEKYSFPGNKPKT